MPNAALTTFHLSFSVPEQIMPGDQLSLFLFGFKSSVAQATGTLASYPVISSINNVMHIVFYILTVLSGDQVFLEYDV